jgi:hypothetical protein
VPRIRLGPVGVIVSMVVALAATAAPGASAAETASPRIVTGADQTGAPLVNEFDLSGTLLGSFFAYDPQFSGGIRVAAGDVNGDGRADVITGAGPGAGPHVEVFSGEDGSLLLSFFAYDPQFAGGVSARRLAWVPWSIELRRGRRLGSRHVERGSEADRVAAHSAVRAQTTGRLDSRVAPTVL